MREILTLIDELLRCLWAILRLSKGMFVVVVTPYVSGGDTLANVDVLENGSLVLAVCI